MRIAIVSANLGSIDSQKEHVKQSLPEGDTVDFFLHDDRNTAPKMDISPRLQAKIYRMLAFDLHRGYDYYIWLDSCFQITSPDFVKWMIEKLGDKKAAFFKHYERDSILSEAKFVEESMLNGSAYLVKRYAGLPLLQQVDSYLQAGYQDNVLLAAGCFIYKPTKNMCNCMTEWLYENFRWSSLDQLSLPYVLWKFKIDYNIIDEHILKLERLQHHLHIAEAKTVTTSSDIVVKKSDIPMIDVADGRPVVDVVMLACSKTKELHDMTQRAIDSLHASERSTKFNVTLVESIQNLNVDNKPITYVDVATARKNFGSSKVYSKEVDKDGFFWINGLRLRGPAQSAGGTISIDENFDSYFCKYRGMSSILHRKVVEYVAGDRDNSLYKFSNYRGCKVIFPTEPFNFNLYMTLGMKHGTAERVLLVNNDLVFKPGFWTVMSRAIDKHKLDSASSRCSKWCFHKALSEKYPKASVIIGCKVSHTIAGWCIATKRSTLNKMGGLDTKAPYYFSDNSYAMQLIKHNLKHGLVMNSIVVHELGVASRACPERGDMYKAANDWGIKNYPGWPEAMEGEDAIYD